MEWNFKGKVALVTGAASGMGLATARAFAKAGAAVALADVNREGVEAAAPSLRDEGFEAIGVRCDVSRIQEVEALVNETVATFGRLDAAFNNAGIQIPPARTEMPSRPTTTGRWTSTCAASGIA